MKTLHEYMNSKGKVEKAKVDIHGDKTDPMTPPTKPPKEHGDKPYFNSNGKDAKKKGEKGLGDQGDKNLEYNPDVKSGSKKGADIPTVPEQFAQYELVPLVSESLEQNPFLAEHIVRDLKRKGVLGILVGELMEHRETYKHISQLAEQSDQIHNKLAKAMRKEEVSPAFSSQTEEDDLEETGLEDVAIDDDTQEIDIEDNDSVGEEDFEIDDTEELGDMNGMGGGETDPNLRRPMPTFQQAMMSRQ